MSTVKINSDYISENMSEFTRRGFVTEDVVTDENGDQFQGTVMVEVLEMTGEERYFTRLYETDDVIEHDDLLTAQAEAFKIAFGYLSE